MSNHIDFSRNLIKGRITETIFEEMFRISEEFTVLPIGYEHTIPELAQYHHHIQVKEVLQNIRNAPDFILISQDKTEVLLVEVKYRHTLNNQEIVNIARELKEIWQTCFLFIATQNEFYFTSCLDIVKNQYNTVLSENWIDRSIQQEYSDLLKEFIK